MKRRNAVCAEVAVKFYNHHRVIKAWHWVPWPSTFFGRNWEDAKNYVKAKDGYGRFYCDNLGIYFEYKEDAVFFALSEPS